MRLLPVHSVVNAATYLYALLLEREESESINHKATPTVGQHLAFVRSNPYREWYLIDDGHIVGAIYLTWGNEVGIFIFKADRGRGLSKQALQMLLSNHRGERILANVNPENQRSISLFTKMGSRLVQLTYEVPA